MRALDANFISALTAPVVSPRLLFEGRFGPTTYNWWSGGKDISWNSKTWQGNGLLWTPDGSSEESMTIKVPGASTDMISLLLSGSQIGQPGTLWFGFVNDLEQLICTPAIAFKGQFDYASIVDEPESPTIEITYVSNTVLLRKQTEYRYNSETQKHFYPDDQGFDHVPQYARGYEVYFGKRKKKTKHQSQDDKNTNKRRRK